jgi:hypothetical protein
MEVKNMELQLNAPLNFQKKTLISLHIKLVDYFLLVLIFKDPFLITFTFDAGLSEDQIMDIFCQFSERNPEGKLKREDFVRLYADLRPEPLEKLEKISDYVFSAFVKDNSEIIDVYFIV